MAQREFPSSPLIGVGAVVLDEQGRALLVKRGTDPGRGRWSIPGGLVELGETLEAAVAREVAEETGLRVAVLARIEVVERIYLEDGPEDGIENGLEEPGEGPAVGPRVRYHYVILDYLCRAVAGELRADSDAEDAMWVGREDWEFESRNPWHLDKDTRWMIERGWQMAAGKAGGR